MFYNINKFTTNFFKLFLLLLILVLISILVLMILNDIEYNNLYEFSSIAIIKRNIFLISIKMIHK